MATDGVCQMHVELGPCSYIMHESIMRVRGTVEAVDGTMLTIKSRDDQKSYKVKLTETATVRGIVKAALSDIKANSYIGVTGMPQADGSQKAVESSSSSYGSGMPRLTHALLW